MPFPRGSWPDLGDLLENKGQRYQLALVVARNTAPGLLRERMGDSGGWPWRGEDPSRGLHLLPSPLLS